MAENLEHFQQFMEEGHNAAWQHDWVTAAQAYRKACELMPENADARINLGLAYLNSGQLAPALKEYRLATKLTPDDPVPLERSADVLERMGKLKDAAQYYVRVADVYLKQRDLTKAIGNWERATQLTPGLVSIHARLAQAYERIGDTKQAIREYLTLAFNFQRMDDVEKGKRAVQRALKMEPNNRQALNTLQALETGGAVTPPTDMRKPRQAVPLEEPVDNEPDLFWSPETDVAEISASNPLGPVGEAMSIALELLAAHMVEIGLDPNAMFVLQGMEFQRQSNHSAAINTYKQADAGGLKHPALHLNLGALLLLEKQAKAAIPYLQYATSDKNLAGGAFHGIGLAYYDLQDHVEASRFLIRSLKAVDTELAANANEIEELNNVYNGLMVAVEGRTTESLSLINERFTGLLSGKEWKQRIAETRRHLDETLRDEGSQGLVDILVARGGDDLPETVASIDRYIRQGLFVLAMDESHRAVEKSPYYLPIHVRQAEIMMKEGRIRQAINKYNTVARAYLVRDENDRAASILEEVLHMAPLDVEVRMSLIELLESEGRQLEVLNQYIELASTYQQLGDFDMSNQTFASAERLARRIDAPADKLVEIKHHIADISQMRLNTRHAQKIYEEILVLKENDEKALRSLVDIYYNQGNQMEAVKRLDVLLGAYARNKEIDKITSLLAELVRIMPQDTALRDRLAKIYYRTGKKKEAIEQLDALGELQLDAGLNKDAARTIKQIIQMGPEQVDDYKKLLLQLNG